MGRTLLTKVCWGEEGLWAPGARNEYTQHWAGQWAQAEQWALGWAVSTGWAEPCLPKGGLLSLVTPSCRMPSRGLQGEVSTKAICVCYVGGPP